MQAIRILVLAIVAISISSCNDAIQSSDVIGLWRSQKAAIVSLQFYSDGTASLSSIGFFHLRWSLAAENSVRIEALDRNAIFDFRIGKDAAGRFGVLELAGFDAAVFRKAN